MLHVIYAVLLIAGLATLQSAADPIADPWFAAMEVLIVLLAAPAILFTCALGPIAGQKGRVWIAAAVAFMTMTFALSASLHAILLTIGRDHPLVGKDGLLAFTWPSAAYAVDILAWDAFFAMGLICCAVALHGVARMAWASRAFLLAGAIALVGLVGPVSDSMALRNVGIFGYAVIFPVAVGAVLRALHRKNPAQKS